MISTSLQLTGPFDVGNHVTSASKLDGLREPHSLSLSLGFKVDPHLAMKRNKKRNLDLLIDLEFENQRNKRELKCSCLSANPTDET